MERSDDATEREEEKKRRRGRGKEGKKKNGGRQRGSREEAGRPDREGSGAQLGFFFSFFLFYSLSIRGSGGALISAHIHIDNLRGERGKKYECSICYYLPASIVQNILYSDTCTAPIAIRLRTEDYFGQRTGHMTLPLSSTRPLDRPRVCSLTVRIPVTLDCRDPVNWPDRTDTEQY